MPSSWSHLLILSNLLLHIPYSSAAPYEICRSPVVAVAAKSDSQLASSPPINSTNGVPILKPDGGKYPFNVEIQGGMNRTDEDAVDGLAVDLFSPTAYVMTIDINRTPKAAKVVSNVGGGPWTAVQAYSWVITTDKPANDLLGILELPYDPTKVQAMGIDVSNLYIGRLSATGNEWIVDGNNRNVHASENKTRVLAMNNMAGEFNLFGRSFVDTAQSLNQFGSFPFAPTRTMNVTAGPGLSNSIWVDNFAISLESPQSDVFVNCLLVSKTPAELAAALPQGLVAVTGFTHLVNTSTEAPYLTGSAGTAVRTPIRADVTMPFTDYQLSMTKANPNALRIAYRAPGQQAFSIVPGAATLAPGSRLVQVTGLTAVDGEFLLVAETGQQGQQGQECEEEDEEEDEEE